MMRYLNTDLDLVSREELTALAAALHSRGAFPLHVTRGEDGRWMATFETERQHEAPEPNIAEMVAIAETLEEPERTAWLRCTHRELNVGYECSRDLGAFQHSLSSQLLGRMAALGASLGLTFYPAEGP